VEVHGRRIFGLRPIDISPAASVHIDQITPGQTPENSAKLFDALNRTPAFDELLADPQAERRASMTSPPRVYAPPPSFRCCQGSAQHGRAEQRSTGAQSSAFHKSRLPMRVRGAPPAEPAAHPVGFRWPACNQVWLPE
jgi:hypothetical protein